MKAARHYSELVAWQLGEEIRIRVAALTARPDYRRDIKASGQVDDASNSICRNIAEGFACESHKEFARYLVFARRSLNELLDELHGAELKGYVTPADIAPIRQLSRRLYPAINRLWAYLDRTPNWKRSSTHRPMPHSTDKRKPSSTNHAKPPSTDEAKRPSTAKAKRPSTDQAQRPSTDKAQRPSTDQRKRG